MVRGTLVVFLACTVFTAVQAASLQYWFEGDMTCNKENIVTRWLKDDDVVHMNGKHTGQHEIFKKCNVQFGPSSEAKNQTLLVMFETFHIGDCDLYLLAQQSPHHFFQSDVSTMFNLTCKGNPGNTRFITQKGNKVRITLGNVKTLNFNFRFRISLIESVDVEPQGLSLGILIGIIAICVVAFIGIICIVVKYMKISRFSKRDLSAEYSNEAPPHWAVPQQQDRPHHQPLNHSHHSPANNSPLMTQASEGRDRYTSMPLLERENQTSDFHACVVEATNSEGRCTICQRQHEDLAHFVSIDDDHQVQPGLDAANNCSLCHRSHEDFAHVVEVNGVTHVTNDPVPVNRSATGHVHMCSHGNRLAPPGGSDWNSDEEGETDPDYAQNVLIPPSYEMAPPSYDEALSMPKPDSLRNTSGTEVDPTYQNLNDLTNQ